MYGWLGLGIGLVLIVRLDLGLSLGYWLSISLSAYSKLHVGYTVLLFFLFVLFLFLFFMCLPIWQPPSNLQAVLCMFGTRRLSRRLYVLGPSKLLNLCKIYLYASM